MRLDAVAGRMCRSGLIMLTLVAGILRAAAPAQAGDAAPASDHIVVLIDLSGFRWDYAARDGAKNLLALGKSGVSAPQGMLPSYPASTLPNAWTLVTGLYPGHHGMVADRFYDPMRKAEFSTEDAKAVADTSWYGGVPLWVLAQRQGMRFACIDWPGCGAKAGGARPSLEASGTKSASVSEKFRQTGDLLRLPDATRPRLIAVYVDEADEAGRKFGPDAAETRAAVRTIDSEVGRLRAAITAARLPVDLVIVSDHGMSKPESDWITLDALADLTGFDAEGTQLYAKTDADAERVYNKLKQAAAEFVAYRVKSAPADLHLAGNARAGDPVIVANGAYAIRAHVDDRPLPKGVDGFDPRKVAEMKGIFFAAGPDIVEGKTVAPFENVHIYPWIAHMLGLTAPKNDGNLNLLSGTLRDDGGDTDQ